MTTPLLCTWDRCFAVGVHPYDDEHGNVQAVLCPAHSAMLDKAMHAALHGGDADPFLEAWHHAKSATALPEWHWTRREPQHVDKKEVPHVYP